ncbi:MAG: FMN-binding protein [Lachnospiraceae bacterium]|nr:FMN-binding protein [Lachnospiraceae bacterium]
MGIITGYLCAILLVLLLAKFMVRRLHWKKADRVLMKNHKYIAFAFLVVAVIHLVLTLKVLAGRNPLVIISGILILVIGLTLTVLCHMLKDRKKELLCHRIFSLFMTLMLIAHMVTYFMDFADYKQAINRIQVRVEDHEIAEIVLLKHITERGKSAESILSDMLDKQSVKVDAVSGATNSSKVIMKACENVLLGELVK